MGGTQVVQALISKSHHAGQGASTMAMQEGLREASEYQRTARTLNGSRARVGSKQLVASAECEANNSIAGPTKEASASTR